MVILGQTQARLSTYLEQAVEPTITFDDLGGVLNLGAILLHLPNDAPASHAPRASFLRDRQPYPGIEGTRRPWRLSCCASEPGRRRFDLA